MKQVFKSPPQAITLPKKLALEASFLPQVKSYFNTIRTDFEKFYSVTGTVISMDEYEDITLSLIKKQYTRCAKVFKRDLRGEKKQEETQETAEDNFISTAIIAFILLKSKISADIIRETNTTQIRDAISKARSALIEQGKEITNRAVAKEASSILKTRFNARAETIAISETQYAVESVKAIEANVLAGEQSFDGFAGTVAVSTVVVSNATKTWETTLDEKTRIAHAFADGQTVKVTSFFIVDGQMLKFPRDTSLGATAKNVINCRCQASYSITRDVS